MKPRTKLEFKVTELSSKLKPLTRAQIDWAFKQLPCYAAMRYKSVICLECNHKWKYDLEKWTFNTIEHKCPSCKKTLLPEEKHIYYLRDYTFFGLIDTSEDFQVIRYFTCWKHMSKKEAPTHYITEVCQQWKTLKGKTTIIAHTRGGYGWSNASDGFTYGSNFSIRKPSVYNWNKYDINPTFIFKNPKVLPEIKRNGFKGKFYGANPVYFFKHVLENPSFETLLKIKDKKFLQYYIDISSSNINEHWAQVKTCIKEKYKINDVGFWIDYLHMAKKIGKDVKNRSVFMPKDLKKAHDEVSLEIQRLEDIRNAEMAERERIRKLEKELEDKFRKESLALKRKHFKGFVIPDSVFKIKALLTTKEMKEEGRILKHCVGRGLYNSDPNSLILSVSIGKNRIETVEVSLTSFKVMQARGYDNDPTEHHLSIIQTVEKNMSKIMKIYSKKERELIELKKKSKKIRTKT